MDAIEIYLSRLITVRDGMKFLISVETMPVKLEQNVYNVLIQLNREIERAKRALAAWSEAMALPATAGSDFTGEPVSDDQLPLIDETVQKKRPVKS